jgi:hypothetical protein
MYIVEAEVKWAGEENGPDGWSKWHLLGVLMAREAK